jgi:chromosome segregation ATPase
VAGCGGTGVSSDILLQSPQGEERRLKGVLQVRDELSGTKASVRDQTKKVQEMGSAKDVSDALIVKLQVQLTDLETDKSITDNKNQQLGQDKTDLQEGKDALEKEKQQLQYKETQFSAGLQEKDKKIDTLSKAVNQWSEAHDNEEQKVDELEKNAIVDKSSLQDMNKKIEQCEKVIEQGNKGRVNLKQINTKLKADLEMGRKASENSQKTITSLRNANEGLVQPKKSMRNNMNEVFPKLQEWLNGGISGEQIAQYCAEMGFHFYPGCTLPSFPYSPQDDEDDDNATPDATERKALGANP